MRFGREPTSRLCASGCFSFRQDCRERVSSSPGPHLGLRASGSHDVVFDDVLFPLDHEIDVRKPDEWLTPDFTQATVHAIFVAAIYDGVARAARDWLIEFLKSRVPSNLGTSLA